MVIVGTMILVTSGIATPLLLKLLTITWAKRYSNSVGVSVSISSMTISADVLFGFVVNVTTFDDEHVDSTGKADAATAQAYASWKTAFVSPEYSAQDRLPKTTLCVHCVSG